ncbi:MAG: hypothetical protein Q9217_005916 [Psora testacea]
MAEYKTYLAANVLNDGKIVSYRMLSRELKVHDNAAKRMLYNFHHSQNSKKPGSVHASYIIEGIPRIQREPAINGHHIDGEDTQMQSSPFLSSSTPKEDQVETGVLVKYITFVKEENLEVFSDCNRSVSKHFLREDPLIAGKEYGVVQNPAVKRQRRTERRPPGVALAAQGPKLSKKPSIPKTQAESQSTSKVGKLSQPVYSNGLESSQHEMKPEGVSEQSREAGKKAAAKPATLKREQSDISKSFSNSKPKSKSEGTHSSAPSAAAANDIHERTRVQEHGPMKDSSEDEQEEYFIANTESNARALKLREERAERLWRMMDENDEDMENPPEEPAQAFHSSEALEKPAPRDATSPEPLIEASGGRRRGRRKVVKKKTVKDEEGYLGKRAFFWYRPIFVPTKVNTTVTKEEPAWESFSDDEPAPAKEKLLLSNLASTAKGKRGGGGKPGQGNIKSFFGKK